MVEICLDPTCPIRGTSSAECPRCKAAAATTQPMPMPAPQPFGCICPPGANRDCENPFCPRKAPLPNLGVNMATQT